MYNVYIHVRDTYWPLFFKCELILLLFSDATNVRFLFYTELNL